MDTPKISTTQAIARPSRTGLFWKLFAIACLVSTLYLGHSLITASGALRSVSLSVSDKKRPAYSWGGYNEKQSEPAIILLKDSPARVTGFLTREGGGEFLILKTQYEEKSELETIVIPWENVLYFLVRTQKVKSP